MNSKIGPVFTGLFRVVNRPVYESDTKHFYGDRPMTALINKTNPITNENISIARVPSGYRCGVGNGLKTLTAALARQDAGNNAADMVSVDDVNWGACTDAERDTITEYYSNESKARRARNVKDFPAGHAYLSAVLPIYAGWGDLGTRSNNHPLSPNSSPEYWRGVVARLQFLIDDAAADDDAPDIATPNEPDASSQFWTGWNLIVRMSPAVDALQSMIADAAANMNGAKL